MRCLPSIEGGEGLGFGSERESNGSNLFSFFFLFFFLSPFEYRKRAKIEALALNASCFIGAGRTSYKRTHVRRAWRKRADIFEFCMRTLQQLEFAS